MTLSENRKMQDMVDWFSKYARDSRSKELDYMDKADSAETEIDKAILREMAGYYRGQKAAIDLFIDEILYQFDEEELTA